MTPDSCDEVSIQVSSVDETEGLSRQRMNRLFSMVSKFSEFWVSARRQSNNNDVNKGRVWSNDSRRQLRLAVCINRTDDLI